MEYRTKLENVKEALENCNLCEDRLWVELPDTPQYMFYDTEDEIRPFLDMIEENIERHGGYMIDEWQFVDKTQKLMNVLSVVRLTLEDK
ncbi:MAG: hypothetical protein IJ762_06115 [Bacteroidaceae bacterium]|nr:hypothetical protein [Bacteroidaceae bacterium]